MTKIRLFYLSSNEFFWMAGPESKSKFKFFLWFSHSYDGKVVLYDLFHVFST
jgi:hypothetical protein